MDNLDCFMKSLDDAIKLGNKEDLLKINKKVNNKLKELVADFSELLS